MVCDPARAGRFEELLSLIAPLPAPSPCSLPHDGGEGNKRDGPERRRPDNQGNQRMIRHCFLLACLLGVAESAPAASWADQLFQEVSKDFGSVPRGPTLTHAFILKNTGSDTVRISSLRVSCGCVTASAPKNILQPGEDSVVQAQMDTTRFQGVKSVTIYVQFDRPKHEEVRLWVRANGRDDVSVVPDTLSFGQVKRGASPSAAARITFQANSQTHITEVQTESNYVQAGVREAHRTPSEVAYDLTAKMRADAPVGHWFTDIWLKTDNAAFPRIRVPLTVEIDSALAATPAAVSFGDVKMGFEVERRVVIRGIKPFLVTGSRGTDRTVSLRDSTDGSKPVHVLTVTFKPDQP